MPELHWPDAYPIVLGAMAVIAVSLVSFFVRKGWFD
jgi:Mg2+ and Co2+ transporter CorA